MRPGRDHPRRPARPGRPGRGPARPRPSPGRDRVRRRRSRTAAFEALPGRQRASRSTDQHHAPAGERVDRAGHPGRGRLRPRRLRQSRAVARGDVPRRVRRADRRRSPDMAADNDDDHAIRPSALGRVYGLGSVFAKTMRDSRRATIAVAAVMGILLIAVTKASSSEFDTPASRERTGRGHPGRAADPGRPGRAAGQHRDPRRLRQLQVRHVLPDRDQPVVDPGPVRHARLRGPARQPRVRRLRVADPSARSRSRSSSATSSR